MFTRKQRNVAVAGAAVAALAVGALTVPVEAHGRRAAKGCATPAASPHYGAGGDLFVTTNDGRLRLVSQRSVSRVLHEKAIRGLGPNETIVGLDTRPSNGQLYALTTASTLYVINPETGGALKVGTMSVAITGGSFGVDWNPTVDRLRVVSDNGQNLRVNPVPNAEGVLATTADTPLNGGSTRAMGAAYTNSVTFAQSTVLYDIDEQKDQLFRQAPPNEGVLVSVGSLGVDAGSLSGFDIDGQVPGRGVAVFTPLDAPNKSIAYSINLDTGRAKRLGTIGGGGLVTAMTFASRPANNVVALADTQLVTVNRSAPNKAVRTVNIVGLSDGDRVTAIDVRPATGALYGLGASGQLYTLSPVTGGANKIGSPIAGLSGREFGFDFNPIVDRIRIVSDGSQNLRVHPDTAAVASTDKPLTQGVHGAAYTNNVAGGFPTTLFDLSAYDGGLFKQDPPNDGTLTRIGTAGIGFAGRVGFDIAADGAALFTGGTDNKTLYCLNLERGGSRAAGSLATNGPVTGLAVLPRI
ncbi:MAG TPA: DUF4394 domain-containing protein [Acidimicrobiales bacterium]|nr:DUF4394 domain-containing protein [Acidimicrobiales bacterium]